MTALEWNGSRNAVVHTTTWNVLEHSGTVVLTVRERNRMLAFTLHSGSVLERTEPCRTVLACQCEQGVSAC